MGSTEGTINGRGTTQGGITQGGTMQGGTVGSTYGGRQTDVVAEGNLYLKW